MGPFISSIPLNRHVHIKGLRAARPAHQLTTRHTVWLSSTWSATPPGFEYLHDDHAKGLNTYYAIPAQGPWRAGGDTGRAEPGVVVLYPHHQCLKLFTEKYRPAFSTIAVPAVAPAAAPAAAAPAAAAAPMSTRVRPSAAAHQALALMQSHPQPRLRPRRAGSWRP